MEEHLSPIAASHLLQQTLRSLCIHEEAQWLYAVFWRILPRNYPPPKWDLLQGGIMDRSRGNRRNWILVWEDGFCNFSSSSGDCSDSHHLKSLKPELFFKMSHEIYSYGEGLIGKVAADHSHKWIFGEPQEHDTGYLSGWPIPCDSYPRTWEAQFQCGIKTIALIAVGEGVLQLGSLHQIVEDLGYVVLLRKRFNYLESIPGVLLPHPSSSSFPFTMEGCYAQESLAEFHSAMAPPPLRVTPSMSSLEALLSKLPPVCPLPQSSPFQAQSQEELMGMEKMTKEELEEDYEGKKLACWFMNGEKPNEAL